MEVLSFLFGLLILLIIFGIWVIEERLSEILKELKEQSKPPNHEHKY